MAKFDESDSYHMIAIKIFNDFELNESCSIYDFIIDENNETITPKGQKVLEELEALDLNANYRKEPTSGRVRRKRTKPANSIGDFVAGKIFKYKVETIDHKIRYTIWRFQ